MAAICFIIQVRISSIEISRIALQVRRSPFAHEMRFVLGEAPNPV